MNSQLRAQHTKKKNRNVAELHKRQSHKVIKKAKNMWHRMIIDLNLDIAQDVEPLSED